MVVLLQPTGGQKVVLCGPLGRRAWTTGIFDCGDSCTVCCCGLLLLPFVLSHLATRLDECPMMPYCIPCPCCCTLSLILLRTKIRTLGAIKGSITGDCVATQCLPCCAVCQMSRELDVMGL
ncbi:placenta-specific gene 8 protein-like [Pomacea canaliculata]|uniref:placenta-specific gene 8 protein-like n=1 Tax=Pomacea canaliculata TaxID=400727 RepID=UPI000D734907|nr:placenta-specific gene 8 protein-like [Pomacea canaliculata]